MVFWHRAVPLFLLLRTHSVQSSSYRFQTLTFVHTRRWTGSRQIMSNGQSCHFSRAFSLSAILDDDLSTEADDTIVAHVVDGIICREVPIDLPVIGTITVLEATAESQENLVDMALALDDEEGELLLEQKLHTGDPYGAVLWPAAWAVANYMMTSGNFVSKGEKDNHLPLQDLSILELGTGTGLVSIAACLGGASSVCATDYEPLALTLIKHAAEKFHNIPIEMQTQFLDMTAHDIPLPEADIVVAADIMYEPKTGEAMAYRAVEALKRGSRVIVGDSPGRPGRPIFLKTLKELGVTEEASFIDAVGKTCCGPRHELICGKGSTSVSEVPKELAVALMDLKPHMLTNKK